VHSPTVGPAGRPGVGSRVCDDIGQALLDSSMALARASRPEVPVRGLLGPADPAQVLIALSGEAHLVVLGSRTAVAGELSLLSSTRVLVSAHALCPVLLLGPVSTFSPPDLVSRIVVGVTDTSAGRAASDFAAAEAVRRRLPLRVLRLEPVESAAVPSRPAHQRAHGLARQVADLRRAHPGLDVTAEVVAGEPAEILPCYTDGSTILVVGCHHSEDHWSTRLGPVATSVIHRMRGAVVVIGSVRRPRVQPEAMAPCCRLDALQR
jgi:nucleotide-binding universal stress UspA family protein